MKAVITMTAAIVQNVLTEAKAATLRIAVIGASFTGIPEIRRRSSAQRVL